MNATKNALCDTLENLPLYSDGAAVRGAGDRMAMTNPSLSAPAYVAANATAADVCALGAALSVGTLATLVYRATDATTLTLDGLADTVCDGHRAVLLLTGGLLLRAAKNVTLKNFVLVGAGITLEDCENVTLENVKVVCADGTALTVDAASTGVRITACRLDGKTGVCNASRGLSLRASYIAFTEAGLLDAASLGTVVRDCRFVGTGTAIITSSDEANVMYNTLRVDAQGVGILMKGSEGKPMQNAIAALNIIRGAQTGVRAERCFNSVVLLNSLISVEAYHNKNFYIIENSLGGRIVAKSNNYIIADCNITAADGRNHATLAADNENTNGDGLTDLTARLKAGANPDLLPHINKDQFLDMPRKGAVLDLDSGESTPIHEYVSQKAKESDRVIIAPGAYNSYDRWYFDGDCNNTTVYAYGVLAERPEKRTERQIYVDGTSDLTFKGLTLLYADYSFFQAYITEKIELPGPTYQFKIHCGAGFIQQFSKTAPEENFGWQKFSPMRRGETYCFYADMGYISIDPQPDADGNFTMTVVPDWYNMLQVGDTMVARMNGARQVSVFGGTNITFYDFTHYAHTGGFSFEIQLCNGNQNFYRTVVTTRPRAVLDKDEYNRYLALEKKYGMSFNMEIDEKGRYRGSLPLVSGLDAVHLIACEKGGTMEYCIFEGMEDDGTNQRHDHARLHALTDNGDGTTTIVFKGNISNQAYSRTAPNIGDRVPRAFRAGDRLLAYTAEGRQVCDAYVLDAQQDAGYDTDWENLNIVDIKMYSVKVPTETVCFEAIEGYDLRSNQPDWRTKICVDNMGYSCSGTYFDNCLMQNLRTRGLLIKSSDVTVKYCTIRNNAMTGASFTQEKLWGESGATQNAKLQNNVFDNAGHAPIIAFSATEHVQVYAPIVFCGYGSVAKEEYCLYRNIEITGNVVKNRSLNNYAMLLKGVQNVLVADNDFGTIYEGEEPNRTSIWLEGAYNVKLEGNLYPPTLSGNFMDGIRCNSVAGIHGSDVEKDGVPLIPDDIYPDTES